MCTGRLLINQSLPKASHQERSALLLLSTQVGQVLEQNGEGRENWEERERNNDAYGGEHRPETLCTRCVYWPVLSARCLRFISRCQAESAISTMPSRVLRY